ncbi:MAG TPA: Hsp33 family molecular chaperone HslO [Syntrophomonas sp.]|jgi:molecular chaperone Hsp33|nr:Hsp33 family molecular chaperone HslO [Syntrophomonas sp.]
MITSDYLLKAMDKNKQVRVNIAHTTTLVEEARRRHNTSATASAALGRVLTAALIMGSDLKNEKDALTLRINGDGIAGPIVASVDSVGHGRAFISNPAADLPSCSPGKLAVGELVGRGGYLEVIKDTGMKQPFVGRVNLVSGEIAEDLSSYFLLSEQIPSLVALGVLVNTDLSIKAAGGLIIQAMPGADDIILEKIENNVLQMDSISTVMFQSKDLESVLEAVMGDIAYEVIANRPLAFKCTCGRERLVAILANLTREEIEETIEQTGKLEVSCNFCGEVYNFTEQEIMYKKTKALD